MVLCATRFIGFFCLLWGLTFATDEAVYRERERRWDTLSELKTTPVSGKSNHDNDSIQPRFLPFSASFSLSSGGIGNSAHSLSVGGAQDGISFSQSTSQSGATPIGNVGSGISASQSSSFAVGTSGISAADSSSFNLNHSTFGQNSQSTSDSFALGQASATAQGNVVNGQAISSANAGAGSSHSLASSGASSSAGVTNFKGPHDKRGRPTSSNIQPNRQVGGVYYPNSGGPKLHVTQGTRGWTQRLPTRRPIRLNISQDDRRWQQRRPQVFISGRPPYRGNRQGETDPHGSWSFEETGRPSGHRESWTENPLSVPDPGTWSSRGEESGNRGIQISGASSSSSSSSSSQGGFSQSHSESQSSLGPNGPTSWTNNWAQSSGDAQGHAKGGAAAVGQNTRGNTQGSFSSSAIAATGNSWGSAVSDNRGDDSRGQVTSQASGTAHVQGTANAGSFRFPTTGYIPQNIPEEFVRSTSSNSKNNQQRRTGRTRNPIGEIITEIGDSVADILDI